jgi:hypothetical protein
MANYDNQENSMRDTRQGIGAGLTAAYNQPAGSLESIPSVLEEVGKLAYEVRMAAEKAADALAGSVPSNQIKGDDSAPPCTVLQKLSEIRRTLQDAIDHQQRIRNALSL